MTAANALMTLNRWDLIIELPSGKDLGVIDIVITTPANLKCSSGTTEVTQ
jgi:hypothetical protein